jgi:putative serine protease PepD
MAGRRSAFLAGFGGALLAVALLGVLAAVGVFGGGGREAASTVTVPPALAASGGTTAVGKIYDRASPGVVSIQAGAASGSGFVLDRQGRIVTNAHVVAGARDVQVQFGEDGPSVDAELVGSDPSSDVAVLRVDPGDVEGRLRPLPLANSDDVRVGDLTVAIGNPFGLPGTATAGIVSALGRQIDAPNGFSISGAIQTDAAINPGNSGGPLLDRTGRVIGVNSQIATGGAGNTNVGIGFAVPANTVRKVVPDLEDDGRVRRAYLGVSTSGSQSGSGALVGAVVPGGPADDAGLQAGDVITRVGGAEIRRPEDISAAIADRKPGEDVRIAYTRAGDDRTVDVHLGVRPEQAP